MKAWIQAVRFPSQAYILIPMILGWSWARGSVNRDFFVLLLCGLFFQFVTVFLNDLMDHEADLLNPNPTFFSGGSRVLLKGALRRQDLWAGVVACWICSLLLAFVLSFSFFLLLLSGYLLLWLYCCPPIEASYRGYGEWLQTIGMGCVLPLLGWITVRPFLEFPWHFLWPLFFLHYSMACLTTMTDMPADLASDKKSVAVRLGVSLCLWHAVAAACCGFGLMALYGVVSQLMCGVFMFGVFVCAHELWQPLGSCRQQCGIVALISMILGAHVLWIAL